MDALVFEVVFFAALRLVPGFSQDPPAQVVVFVKIFPGFSLNNLHTDLFSRPVAPSAPSLRAISSLRPKDLHRPKEQPEDPVAAGAYGHGMPCPHPKTNPIPEASNSSAIYLSSNADKSRIQQ